jgi:ribosomal protein S18 acetylase RimI-like enzyme
MVDLPAPPRIDGVTFRHASEIDSPAIVALQDACYEVDRTYREVESEILDRFDNPGIDPEVDSLLIVDRDGALIASVWSILPAASTWWRAFGEVHVHPQHRIEPWLSFTQEWWEARSRQRLAAIDDDLDRVLWMSVYEHETERIAFLESRGYEVRRYYDELLRDLSAPIEPRPLPSGITLVPAEEAPPGDELLVHNEAFRDHWGSQPFTQERWDHFKDEFYLPDSSWVAYDGDAPVGHIMCGQWPQDFEDRGFRHSWILSVGVLRSHRGRGVASAMITGALEDFAADGMEYGALDVDSENPSGAYGLYEGLGFVLDRRTLAMLKPV